ncbi:MAG TPA: metallophosphoesterase [Alphaproteobacteria bacterium]|nr:metallophosphoesterase [Alphaproteobacteria bacterium]
MANEMKSQQPDAERRKLLKCMMAGSAGVLWSVTGGVPMPFSLAGEALAATGNFTFMQISDTHIGFKAPANPDPAGTLKDALAKVGAVKPSLLLHTGDVSHLTKPEEFDMAAQIMKLAGMETHYVPGEHDTINDNGKSFFERFGHDKRTEGGWYSFDQGGIHFVGLVNVVNLRPGGLGYLGPDQLAWLTADLKGKTASTPIVVFAHMPLWTVSAAWGWGTDDAAPAIEQLKRFGSATVLNGHIHQVIQKVEGKVTLQTARSTAFPQAAPDTPGAGPGPLKVAAEQLKSVLGVRRVDVTGEKVALTDATLAA